MKIKLITGKCLLSLIVSLSTLTAFAEVNLSQNFGRFVTTPKGKLFFPSAGVDKPSDVQNGIRRAHPQYVIFIPDKKANNSYFNETPASLACIYGLTANSPGCNPNTTTTLPNGGWGTIALVDAFDDSTAEADLNVFSSHYGLPTCTSASGCFSKVYASGSQPADCGSDPYDNWCPEISLDIEWAHAMAPHAKVVLVEADEDTLGSLFAAEQRASTIVHNNGGGEISNSWGNEEFASETSDGLDDLPKTYLDIAYFAATGDYAAPAAYPATSPYFVATGGSSVVRDVNGNFLIENAWGVPPNPSSTGSSAGGPSLYEARPAYQNMIQKIVGSHRGTPDISFDGDPQSGVYIYDSNDGGWYTTGGTSVASPALAGIVNVATGHPTSTAQVLNTIYTGFAKNYLQYWRPIASGYNGYYAQKGYNFVTGIGTPLTYQGK